MLLSIDPGLSSGWAVFKDQRIHACGLVASYPQGTSLDRHRLEPGHRAVIEVPRIYPKGRTKNPNDVLKVALNAGEWGGWARHCGVEPEYVEPAEWKGGAVDKKIQWARDWAKLQPDEQAIVALAGKGLAPSLREHVLDAVGVGLFALKRR